MEEQDKKSIVDFYRNRTIYSRKEYYAAVRKDKNHIVCHSIDEVEGFMLSEVREERCRRSS